MEDSTRNEVWRDIDGYAGLYQVSSLGRVRSLPRLKVGRMGSKYYYGGKMLTPSMGDKYLVVLLYDRGRRIMRHVHRLVAETFIPNDDHSLVVNHINEIKTDNRVCNLEWVTQKENINHGTRNLRAANSSRNRADCSKPVMQFTKTGEFVALYPSISEAARQMNCSVCAILNCIAGRSQSARRYVWKLK